MAAVLDGQRVDALLVYMESKGATRFASEEYGGSVRNVIVFDESFGEIRFYALAEG